MATKKRKIKLIQLEWQDIEEHNGWMGVDPSHPNLVILKSFGLVAAKNRWWIALANCYDPETEKFSGVHKYPRGAVTKETVIQIVEYPKVET